MKNTTAKFSNKTKQIILDRDICCILCSKQWIDCHHVYFGLEAEYWKDRNDPDKWVLLCRECHKKPHWCKAGEWDRQKCIDYIRA